MGRVFLKEKSYANTIQLQFKVNPLHPRKLYPGFFIQSISCEAVCLCMAAPGYCSKIPCAEQPHSYRQGLKQGTARHTQLIGISQELQMEILTKLNPVLFTHQPSNAIKNIEKQS